MEVEARKFLKRHRMSWEGLDLILESKAFCKEMEAGLCGDPSTLKMLPSYIDPSIETRKDQEVVVVDAGGTHFRTGLLHFTPTGPTLHHMKIRPMPGSQGELEAEEFFQEVADSIVPELGEDGPRRLGLCFSYPIQITPERDGRLISFTKELRVKDAEGLLIGEELSKKLPKPVSITVLNDATATLLGGVAVGHTDNRLHSICMILGTGMNTSYVEENHWIRKEPMICQQPGLTVVNLESGGYGKVERGTADLRMDEKTTNPGSQLLEKMMSGAYLGNLFLETILLAAEEGHLPAEAFGPILQLGTLSTKHMTGFAQGSGEEDSPLKAACEKLTPTQEEFLHVLAKGLLRRAAKLAVINIAGIALRMRQSNPEMGTIPLIMEGSTFYGSNHIQHYMDAYLKQVHMRMGIHVERMQLGNAALLGAGVAAFS